MNKIEDDYSNGELNDEFDVEEIGKSLFFLSLILSPIYIIIGIIIDITC